MNVNGVLRMIWTRPNLDHEVNVPSLSHLGCFPVSVFGVDSVPRMNKMKKHHNINHIDTYHTR